MIYVAWTGHRTQHLPSTVNYVAFERVLDGLGMGARKDVAFVTGGAIGIDAFAAEYALRRGLPLHMRLPFDPDLMGNRWRDEDRLRLKRHIANATTCEVLDLSGVYSARALHARNEAMVDMAQHVFTVYLGKPGGGTYSCIRYALKRGKPVYNLYPMNGALHPIKEIA